MTSQLEHPCVADVTGRPPHDTEPASPASDEARLAPICEALQAAFRPNAIERSHALELARMAVRFHLLDGTPIFREASPCDALWLLGRGRASVGVRDRHGRWRQRRSVQAGQWLDIASAWLGETFLETAVADTGLVVAYEFPVGDVQRLCRRRPEIAMLLVSTMARRVRSATEEVGDLAARDVPGRLARWLLANIGRTGQEPGEVIMDRRKRTLAAELNTSPETLSRALGRLRQLGLIVVDGYRIDILDPRALRNFSGWSSEAERAAPFA
jgi:CRP-like cAMP-binding protein